MSENDRRWAFDRFWQGAGTQGGHSGLGLAIVRQPAVRNDASVQLRPSEPNGLAAVLRMPTAHRSEGKHSVRSPRPAPAGRP